MNVFVTGASGFIGRSLVDRLASQGHAVCGLYRQLPKYPVMGDIVIGDMENISSWEEKLRGVECVVHLAGRAHKLDSNLPKASSVYFDLNRVASIALGKACISTGVKRMIFMSSIGVNGNETAGKSFNEHSAPAPFTDYAKSKWEAEQQLISLLNAASVELVRIRPPLVYGAAAIGNFQRLLQLVSRGLPMPFGAVDNKRSIISLASLVAFISCIITAPQAADELYLVADDPPLSTSLIMRSLANGMSKTCYQVPVPVSLLRMGAAVANRQNLYQQLCGSLVIDTSKARSVPGWQPSRSVEQSLAEVGKVYLARPKS